MVVLIFDYDIYDGILCPRDVLSATGDKTFRYVDGKSKGFVTTVFGAHKVRLCAEAI